MKYLKLISLLFVCTLGSLFASCEETAEVDEYAKWQRRNSEFIDSIAQEAAANTDGKWLKILSFKLNETDLNGNTHAYSNDCYVYCHIVKDSVGTEHPLTLVSTNYRGRLIPTDSHPEGKVFDESFKGTLNPATNKPVEFDLSGVIVGWQTALIHMTKGDIWHVYIPSKLGYGSSQKTDIPAHSTLVFDINLVDFVSATEK